MRYANCGALRSFVNAAPCGLVELRWEPCGDFRFTRLNQIARSVIEPISNAPDPLGQLLCRSIPGHTTPSTETNGLSLYEVYRRIAFAIPPYESGRRDATIEFNIDLDKFKSINDGHGHQAGDDAIVWAAQQIKSCTRQDEPVGRMGGDEFAVLVRGDVATAKRTAERIRTALSQPFRVAGKQQQISASIGVAIAESDGQVVDDRADAAQRDAKQRGGNAVVVWGDLEGAANRQYQFEQKLQQAICGQDFVLHYQPIVRLNTGETEGYEALVRWQKGDELIYPDRFIPLLENLGKLHLLSGQIFQMAADDQRKLSEWISVNVSPSDLDRDNFRDLVAPLLASPGNGHFEVTERLQLSLKLISSEQSGGVSV